MLKLRRLKAKQRRTNRKPYNTMALVVLFVGASWQGIINAPIESNIWSLPPSMWLSNKPLKASMY